MALWENFDLPKSWHPLERFVTLSDSFDNGDISEDKFLFLYDVNTCKNPDFSYECYGKFNLNEKDDSECLAEFCFHKSDIPVLLEALQLSPSFKCHHGQIWNWIDKLCIALRRFAYCVDTAIKFHNLDTQFQKWVRFQILWNNKVY